VTCPVALTPTTSDAPRRAAEAARDSAWLKISASEHHVFSIFPFFREAIIQEVPNKSFKAIRASLLQKGS